MPRRAALFDLDRTLVTVNTAALYLRWQARRGEVRAVELAQLFYWLVQYKMGVLNLEGVANKTVLQLRGRDERLLEEILRAWVMQEVMPRVSERGRAEVERRKADGYLCAILTSSTNYSAAPLAEALGIDHVLASRLEVADGLFTGGFVRPLCYGPGKVALAESWARTHDVNLDQSAFFTDSISDLPMLERVGEKIVVNPDPRLRVHAWRKGWRVERW